MNQWQWLPILPAILAVASLLAVTTPAPAQMAITTGSTVSLVMLSDIHFDPFHDPAKFAQLAAAPVQGWAAILASPQSPSQAVDFAKLQNGCGARGVDTPMALLQDSLRAAHERNPGALFVTVSGDLMAHRFDCRFRSLASHLPGGRDSPADLSAFATKTVAFIALELRHAFPGTPVYFALGNNDSGCDDYSEDPNSAFLRAAADSFAADAIDPENRAAILKEFPQLGDYSVMLPAPMVHARLIVLQDIFESKNYAACNGKAKGDSDGDRITTLQTAWLRSQLTAARAAHEHVWVMAHIPPGIDVYSTLTKGNDVCGGGAPAMFLNGNALAETLTAFPDVVRLGIFAHTHMDELRLLKSSSGDGIPVKIVPSISPVDGNAPSFTVAEVNPLSATLEDYAVYVDTDSMSPDSGGTVAVTGGDHQDGWRLEYRYSTAYGLPDFSGHSLEKLTADFAADKNGGLTPSRSYQSFYFAGQPAGSNALKAELMMRLLWPIYVCSVTKSDASDFRGCVCPAKVPANPAIPPSTGY